MITLIVSILVVLIGSALCSGSEASLFSISMVKVRQLAEGDSKAAKALLNIKEKMDAPIASIVILNNIANIVGSITIGGLAAQEFGGEYMGYFSACLTFMVILCSEIIPKTVGEMYAEKISLIIARPIILITRMLYPIIWLLNIITLPLTKHARKFTTDESEITFLTKMGKEIGVIEKNEADMIQQVFKMNDKTAYDIMTPRVKMSCVDISKRNDKDFDYESFLTDITQSEHTRIIAIDGRYDNVMGVIFKTDAMRSWIEGDSDIDDLIQPIHEFQKTTKADKMLCYFQESRKHIALVKDEFGGVSGVVTLEDVIEIITGEIMDETDRTEDLRKV